MKYTHRLFGLLTTLALLLALWAIPVHAADKTPFDSVPNAHWDEQEPGVARWDKVEKARLYEVLLCQENLIIKKVEVSSNQVSLLEYMEDHKFYTFQVRAIPKSSQKTYSSGPWSLSDEWIASGVGDTSGRFRTYREGSRYQLEDGTYVKDQWKLIQAHWYYFNADGYMQTDWILWNGQWYYLGTDGKMQTGWIQLDGTWYYLRPDGSMYSGWIQYQPGQWYYLAEDGRMLVDTVIDGHHLDSTGLRID